jgi:hypothetical protein
MLDHGKLPSFMVRLHGPWCKPTLTFVGRSLENKKKLTPVRILNSVNLNSKNIMNNVGIFNDGVALNNNFKEYSWNKQ